MNISDYEKIIEKTAVYPKEVNNFGVAYTWMGLLDEYAEFVEKRKNLESQKEINKEKGDVLWYMTALCKETNLSFEELMKYYFTFDYLYTNNSTNVTMYVLNRFTGNIKKYYRDNKKIDVAGLIAVLLTVLGSMFDNVKKEEILTILEENYDKLIKRRLTNTLHGDGDSRENTPKTI